MKVLLYVDNKGYTKKMTDQTPCIINRILRLKCEITVEELAEAVGQYGHSFTPAVFKDGAKQLEWKSKFYILTHLDFMRD